MLDHEGVVWSVVLDGGGVAGAPRAEHVSEDPGAPSLGHCIGVPPAGPSPAASEAVACERASVPVGVAAPEEGCELAGASWTGACTATAAGTATNERSSTAATARANVTHTVDEARGVDLAPESSNLDIVPAPTRPSEPGYTT
jgi:hypothetical protein